LYLYVYDDNEDAATYAIWDKVGQGIGNLEALESLNVYVSGDPDSGPIAWHIWSGPGIEPLTLGVRQFGSPLYQEPVGKYTLSVARFQFLR
jgi:hypothetical protein